MITTYLCTPFSIDIVYWPFLTEVIYIILWKSDYIDCWVWMSNYISQWTIEFLESLFFTLFYNCQMYGILHLLFVQAM